MFKFITKTITAVALTFVATTVDAGQLNLSAHVGKQITIKRSGGGIRFTDTIVRCSSGFCFGNRPISANRSFKGWVGNGEVQWHTLTTKRRGQVVSQLTYTDDKGQPTGKKPKTLRTAGF